MGSSPLQFACRASGPTWTRTRTRTRARPCTSSPRSWTPPASPSIKWWEQVRTCNHSDTAARRRWAPSSVSHFENCRRGGTARVVASHKSPSSLPLRPLTFLKSHFKRRKKTKGVLFVAAAGRSDAVRTCTAGNEKHLMPAAQGLFLRQEESQIKCCLQLIFLPPAARLLRLSWSARRWLEQECRWEGNRL